MIEEEDIVRGAIFLCEDPDDFRAYIEHGRPDDDEIEVPLDGSITIVNVHPPHHVDVLVGTTRCWTLIMWIRRHFRYLDV